MQTACPLLWNHSFISTTSQVRPCCRAKTQHLTPDWKNSNFTDGVNTEAHISARKQMREGKWPSSCTICKVHEKKFGHSARLQYLEEYEIDYTKEPSIEDIQFIDVKFNNICNLACVMCNTDSSSELNKLVKTHANSCPTSMGMFVDIDWQEQKKLNWCKEIISYGNLKVLKTTGGEPFAQKHFWELIDWCIENSYTYFDINLTTNGTKFNRKFLDKLVKFKSIQLTISCDGTGTVYDYIRFGSDWGKFKQNIVMLNEYVNMHPNTFSTPNLHCVLQAYNCHNIDQLYDYAKEQELNFTLDCFINPYDSIFSIESIPKKIRKKIISKSQLKYVQDHNIKKYITTMLNTRYNKTLSYDLKKYTYNLDSIRHTNYALINSPYDLTKID